VQERLQTAEWNGRARGDERERKGDARFNRITYVPKPPVIIASSLDIGTKRVIANSYDAAIDYFTEQEQLKAAGAPI
jgi:hypothetical protein